MTGNVIKFNNVGLALIASYYNIYDYNQIIYNFFINVYEQGCENIFTRNTIEGSPIGILFNGTYSNQFINNSISDNEVGLMVVNSTDNLIEENQFNNNSGYAILFTNYSNGNTIFHNDFVDNNNGSVQAYDDSGNEWTDENGVGNYWSDYDERYPDATSDESTWTTGYELDGELGISDGGSQVVAFDDPI